MPTAWRVELEGLLASRPLLVSGPGPLGLGFQGFVGQSACQQGAVGGGAGHKGSERAGKYCCFFFHVLCNKVLGAEGAAAGTMGQRVQQRACCCCSEPCVCVRAPPELSIEAAAHAYAL